MICCGPKHNPLVLSVHFLIIIDVSIKACGLMVVIYIDVLGLWMKVALMSELQYVKKELGLIKSLGDV